jgi:hypothetical protein
MHRYKYILICIACHYFIKFILRIAKEKMNEFFVGIRSICRRYQSYFFNTAYQTEYLVLDVWHHIIRRQRILVLLHKTLF